MRCEVFCSTLFCCSSSVHALLSVQLAAGRSMCTVVAAWLFLYLPGSRLGVTLVACENSGPTRGFVVPTRFSALTLLVILRLFCSFLSERAWNCSRMQEGTRVGAPRVGGTPPLPHLCVRVHPVRTVVLLRVGALVGVASGFTTAYSACLRKTTALRTSWGALLGCGLDVDHTAAQTAIIVTTPHFPHTSHLSLTPAVGFSMTTAGFLRPCRPSDVPAFGGSEQVALLRGGRATSVASTSRQYTATLSMPSPPPPPP